MSNSQIAISSPLSQVSATCPISSNPARVCAYFPKTCFYWSYIAMFVYAEDRHSFPDSRALCPNCNHNYVKGPRYDKEGKDTRPIFWRYKICWVCRDICPGYSCQFKGVTCVCGKEWDGSEVYGWKCPNAGWKKEEFRDLDMDQFELDLKRHNIRVRRERIHALVECDRCGKKWKGCGALKTHQKKCL